MLKIGTFSKLCQISVRMLRYYDEAGLLKPARVDPQSGYRLYAAWQIPIANRIRFLRDLNFNMGEIAAALAQWPGENLAEILARKESELRQQMRATEGQIQRIQSTIADLQEEKAPFEQNVSLKSVPAQPVLSLRRVIPDYYAEAVLWKELSSFAKSGRFSLAGETLSIYHDPEYKERNVDVELCALLDGPLPQVELPEGFALGCTRAVAHMAYCMAPGPFSQIAPAFLALGEYLETLPQYALLDGSSRQIVHRGPWNEENPADYLTEIQIPLRPLDSHSV